ncbi:barstar family protein [Nocardioides bizhenqiangii]|uniref:Barstar family protein n=1 Tax=Nocardioides bizhenqiangii TaxID=3095076 RepID=A0ABZ0ZMM0_9ACTN|nr:MULTISPECIES: barstar family protein [unclassified Nocardioides]MDZ5620668.1 barstar family protein [Nocardioides sp. HM23]WQQ25034.1 barstar family protein [Nocardioides sp. HM61]
MSGLAAVLAGRHDAGVHRWHNALHVPDVQHAVEHAGWTFGYVDGVALESEQEILGAIGAALSLPEGHDGDVDALKERLDDLGAKTVLLWDGWGSLARAEPTAFEKVCRVLGTRSNGDPSLEVLLRGPGPEDTGITSLD